MPISGTRGRLAALTCGLLLIVGCSASNSAPSETGAASETPIMESLPGPEGSSLPESSNNQSICLEPGLAEGDLPALMSILQDSDFVGADQLLDGVRSLVPAPESAPEALSRFLYLNPEVASCGDGWSELPGPRRGSIDGTITAVEDLFGICYRSKDDIAYQDWTARALCEDGDRGLALNLESGDLSVVDLHPEQDWRAMNGGFLAVREIVKESDGLGDPEAEIVATYVMDSGSSKDISVLKGAVPELVSLRNVALGSRAIVGSWRSSPSENLPARGSAVLNVDSGKSVVIPSDLQNVRMNFVSSQGVGGEDYWIDLSTGEHRAGPIPQLIYNDGCPSTQLVGLADEGVARYVDGEIRTLVRTDGWPVMGTSKTLVVTASGGPQYGALGLDRNGDERWRLDLQMGNPLFGWIVVFNRSGKRVMVDPDTGKEGEDGSGSKMKWPEALGSANEYSAAAINQTSDKVIVKFSDEQTSGGYKLLLAQPSEVCR